MSVETIQGKPQAPDETQVNDAIRGCVSVLKIAALTGYYWLVLVTCSLQSLCVGGDMPTLSLSIF